MWRISPGNERLRYCAQPIASAQSFFESSISQIQTTSTPIVDIQQTAQAKSSLLISVQSSVQSRLLTLFREVHVKEVHVKDVHVKEAHIKDAHIKDAQAKQAARREKEDKEKQAASPLQQAQAGLCLRCYVSLPILRACQKLDSLFAGDKAFSYQDLLPFVLNDDGEKLLIVDENKTQLIVDGEKLTPSTYRVFSLDVLQSYRQGSLDNMSLDNWTFLRTKQHPELKSFLSEFGFKPFSDWALINRIQVNQLARLADSDRQIVEAFHAVYLRDRRQKKISGRCSAPTASQLSEINSLLIKQGIEIADHRALLAALKQIGTQLREFDIWQARAPLEIEDNETGQYRLRADLPAYSMDEVELEDQAFLNFINQQLARSLTEAIKAAIAIKQKKLSKSKRYAPFADSYRPGLLRYYQEGISLKAIGQQLGMNNWDQTRRILNPGELLSHVRLLTIQTFLEQILKQAQAKGFTSNPPQPDYLASLMSQIETFLDEKLFIAAAAELKTGKNRSLDSEYAQYLVRYLTQASSPL